MATKYLRSSRLGIILVCSYYLICLGCQSGNKPDTDTSTVPTTLPEDFIEFYKAFHEDSAYQLSHITFPLSGTLQDTAGRDSAVTWQAQNWKLHKSVTPDDLWAVDFTVPLEGVVVEFIHARAGGYWMERRFAKMDQEWYLIYYGGLKTPRELTEEEASTLQ